MTETSANDLTKLTVDLLSAYVANNNVRTDDLPALIASTHAALTELAAPRQDEPEPEPVEQHRPAVTARKSLADPNFIISMIDGKPYKTLKRHLTGRGMTPDEYRTRYKLPATYPMVAPGYSDTRREVAKRLGLGRKLGSAGVAASAKPARKPRTPKPPAES